MTSEEAFDSDLHLLPEQGHQLEQSATKSPGTDVIGPVQNQAFLPAGFKAAAGTICPENYRNIFPASLWNRKYDVRKQSETQTRPAEDRMILTGEPGIKSSLPKDCRPPVNDSIHSCTPVTLPSTDAPSHLHPVQIEQSGTEANSNTGEPPIIPCDLNTAKYHSIDTTDGFVWKTFRDIFSAFSEQSGCNLHEHSITPTCSAADRMVVMGDPGINYSLPKTKDYCPPVDDPIHSCKPVTFPSTDAQSRLYPDQIEHSGMEVDTKTGELDILSCNLNTEKCQNMNTTGGPGRETFYDHVLSSSPQTNEFNLHKQLVTKNGSNTDHMAVTGEQQISLAFPFRISPTLIASSLKTGDGRGPVTEAIHSWTPVTTSSPGNLISPNPLESVPLGTELNMVDGMPNIVRIGEIEFDVPPQEIISSPRPATFSLRRDSNCSASQRIEKLVVNRDGVNGMDIEYDLGCDAESMRNDIGNQKEARGDSTGSRILQSSVCDIMDSAMPSADNITQTCALQAVASSTLRELCSVSPGGEGNGEQTSTVGNINWKDTRVQRRHIAYHRTMKKRESELQLWKSEVVMNLQNMGQPEGRIKMMCLCSYLDDEKNSKVTKFDSQKWLEDDNGVSGLGKDEKKMGEGRVLLNHLEKMIEESTLGEVNTALERIFFEGTDDEWRRGLQKPRWKETRYNRRAIARERARRQHE